MGSLVDLGQSLGEEWGENMIKIHCMEFSKG